MKKFILFTGIVLFLFSCGSTENNKLILGNWSGVAWMKDGKPSGLKADETAFTFNEKGQYTFTYSGKTENGKYKVENDMLFTTADGEREIMVRINSLTADSLIFDMSRSGQAERLILIKK